MKITLTALLIIYACFTNYLFDCQDRERTELLDIIACQRIEVENLWDYYQQKEQVRLNLEAKLITAWSDICVFRGGDYDECRLQAVKSLDMIGGCDAEF